MFEIVYDDDDDGRTDGRRLDRYTISSPCEPNGSGELIRRIGPAASEKKLFENVDDGRRIPIYTKSSPMSLRLR